MSNFLLIKAIKEEQWLPLKIINFLLVRIQ